MFAATGWPAPLEALWYTFRQTCWHFGDCCALRIDLPDHAILPLTFLQTYRSASFMSETPVDSISLRYVTLLPDQRRIPIVRALHDHLFLSGYGLILDGEIKAGLYLRGWRQMLYVARLVIDASRRGQGLERELLGFAERQAGEQRREWVGLAVNPADEQAVELCRVAGFHLEHAHIWHGAVSRLAWPQAQPSLHLQPLGGAAALRAYLEYSRQDIEAGEPQETAIQNRLLDRSPYYQPGRDWLILDNGRPIAYLHRHNRADHALIYVAFGPEWWGHPYLAQVIELALAAHPPVSHVDVRLGSRQHHERARAILLATGLDETTAPAARMFKRLADLPGGSDASLFQQTGVGS